ncbi:neural cell adhesion molecule L1.1-like isoform X2 [Salarias fasciatus]|uniref:neural cell adhesion molecule L1.1-like isoform X2 n=1 Tax=Salarias fasciatus TaxID=181472 RepID=UPI0011765B9A|nr:neural cell adhesion molecule L1.1-like isoform X2 [Salarias fasciatus]
MCVSERRWTGSPVPPPVLPPVLLLFLALSSFISSPPLAQAEISIPENYKVENMSQPPVLTEIPTSYTAFSLEDINLPCEASGNPTPTFRWVRNGTEFGPELQNSGNLRADEDKPVEWYAGFYRCYASNALGTAVTPAVQLIVEPHPVLLKKQKVHREAYEGDSLILSCNPPRSSTPPHIHWMDKRIVHIRQSERVVAGLDGNLYFSNLLKSDSRDDYICHAQYTEARIILPQSAVTLRVLPSNDVVHGRRPHLFLPSGSHSAVLALQGQTLTLECIPKGLPTPTVEWTKKDGGLDETSGRVENYGRWLTFHSISQSDDGEYQCHAANSHGAATHGFTVTVEAAPYLVKEPRNRQYAPGETVRLDCQADGIPTPRVHWSINGQPVADVDEEPRRSVSGGTLILRDVRFSDTAVYQCEASNKHGSVLVNAFLYVVELSPQILSSDGLVYRAVQGRDVRMLCESFGSPKPHIAWEGEDRPPLLSDPRVSLLTDGTLELSNVSHSDVGVYSCSVQTSNVSIRAHLEVYDRTVILTPPQSVRVLRGTAALLDCGFVHDARLGDVQVVWKRDGTKLQESTTDDKYTIFENNTLRVSDAQLDDTALYSCEVITGLDHVDQTGSITVVAPPEPPHFLSLLNVEDSSLTLSWIPGPTNNSPVSEFVVEAAEEQQSGGGWKWAEFRRVPGDFDHAELRLRPYCTYRFRVSAVNQAGRSAPSRPSDPHSTPPAVPDRNPVAVRSNSSEPGTLSITWEELDRRSHNGPDFQYKVLWREADGPNTDWNVGFVRAPPFVVNNTGTYTPFEMVVQAVNSVGQGPKPEPSIGHSGEDKPEEPPTGVSSRVINSTVRLSWNEAKKVRGLLLGYKIYLRRLGAQERRSRRSLEERQQQAEQEEGRMEDSRVEDSRVEVVGGSQTWSELTGLRLFSRYQVSMTAFNSRGESPPSPPHYFLTPEGAPGPPASLRFESPSESSLILFWSPPLEPNGVLLGYMVQYEHEVASRDSLLQIVMIMDPSVTHIELDSLDPNSQYTFKVIARTAAGDGRPIERSGATLLDGVPPSNITVVPGNTSFNLTWVPGERDRNQGFHFQYIKADAPPGSAWKESEVVNSTQGFYVLTGLQPGSAYNLMVSLGNATLWSRRAATTGPVPWEVPGGFAAQGWLIGLISAVVLLVLILLILCLIKRSRGGKYAVKDKEDKEVDSEARPMKDETFGEYSDGDEKHSGSQPSLCGDSKLGSDDSLAEYGDSVDIQFNEDGSFIGQYSGRGPVAPGNESSGPASPVNAAPPPPIAPSMSSILNRPS